MLTPNKTSAFILTLLFNIMAATAQTYAWAGRGGGEINFSSGSPQITRDYEHIRDVKVDSQNNYYFLATISSGNTDLQGITITNYNKPTSGKDTFLFSTDCDGNMRWQKTIGGWNVDSTQGLSIDSSDNIYVTGRVLPRIGNNDGLVHYDTDVVINTNLTVFTPGPHNKSMYLIKYDSNGVFQWLQRPEQNQVESTGVQKAYNFGHVTDSNNVTHWLMTMGSGTHINGSFTATSDIYGIFRFDDQGNYMGQTPVDMSYNGGRADYGTNLEYDEVLNRYYVSYYRGNSGSEVFTFMGTQINYTTLLAAIEYDTGNLVWQLTPAREDSGTRISALNVDSQSNIYITGDGVRGLVGPVPESLAGHVFDNVDSSGGRGNRSPFLIKLDSQGNLIWGNNSDFSSQEEGYDIALNGNEVAIATGLQIPGTWDTATFTRPGNTNGDPVVVRFDAATGVVLGIHDVLGSSGSADAATAVAADSFGNYVTGGYMRSSTLFQNTTGITPLQRNGNGTTDFWYAKLATTDCNGVPLSTLDQQLDKAQLFPNPTTGWTTVSTTTAAQSVILYDTLGRIVLEQELDQNNRFDAGGLPQGIYIVRVLTDSGVVVTRLVRE
jgi:hypothetical protein